MRKSVFRTFYDPDSIGNVRKPGDNEILVILLKCNKTNKQKNNNVSPMERLMHTIVVALHSQDSHLHITHEQPVHVNLFIVLVLLDQTTTTIWDSKQCYVVSLSV